jgi:excisionase family DNA binding protein
MHGGPRGGGTGTTPAAGTTAPPAAAPHSAAPGAGHGAHAAPSPNPDGRLSEVKFLTVAEVAQVMRVSKMTVYRLVHSGELPAVRVGRSFRVPEQAVQDYLRDAYVTDVA